MQSAMKISTNLHGRISSLSSSSSRSSSSHHPSRIIMFLWKRALFVTATTTFAIHDPMVLAFSFAYNNNHQNHHHHHLMRCPFHTTAATAATTTTTTCLSRTLSRTNHHLDRFRQHGNKHLLRQMSSSSESSSSSEPSESSSSNNNNNNNNNDNQNKHLSPKEFILNRVSKEDHSIIETTLTWVKGTVIGLNFCPFAERPYNTKQLFIDVIHGSNQTDIISNVLAECLVRQKVSGTSLLVCPDLFPNNFYSFLEVYNILQDGILVDNDLTDDLQIAPFHPQFQFEGSGSDGIDNYTNRSPYPIFHILREEEVSHAVDILDGDASKVWKRNIQLLEALQDEFLQDDNDNYNNDNPKQQAKLEDIILTGGTLQKDETVNKKIKEILKRFKQKKSSEK